jgi:hypothetical protein
VGRFAYGELAFSMPTLADLRAGGALFPFSIISLSVKNGQLDTLWAGVQTVGHTGEKVRKQAAVFMA